MGGGVVHTIEMHIAIVEDINADLRILVGDVELLPPRSSPGLLTIGRDGEPANTSKRVGKGGDSHVGRAGRRFVEN